MTLLSAVIKHKKKLFKSFASRCNVLITIINNSVKFYLIRRLSDHNTNNNIIL